MLLGYHFLLEDKPNRFIAVMAFTAVVFRSEVVALMGPIVLFELATRRMNFKRGFVTGVVAGFLSIGLCIRHFLN